MIEALTIGVTVGLTYSLLALGMVLIYKGSRTINFAHPYFGLLAAFLCWWLTARAGFLPFDADSRPRFAIAVVLALVLIGLNGFAIEHNLIRRLRTAPRLVMLVATIALAQGSLGLVFLLFARNEAQFNTGRRLPTLITADFTIGTRVVTGADIQVFIVVVVLCVVAALFFRYTRFGIAIRAAAENPDTARLLGISVNRVSSFTWVVGSVLAGIAGILIAEVRGSLDVATLSTGFLVRGLAAALIGGLTSLPGAVVGGLFVGISEELLKWMTNDKPGAPETLLFVAVLAVLLFRPGGIFGQREETEDKAAFIPTLRELPAKLRTSTSARGLRVLGVLVGAFVCLISLVTGVDTNSILALIVIYAMVGVSLTMLMGFTGQISLGHWGLAGVGAFALANFYTRLHIPYLISLPLAFVVGALVSLLIGFSALRIRGLYLAVATLAFNLAAEFFLFKERVIGRSTSGIEVKRPKLWFIDLNSPTHRPMFFFLVFFLVVVMVIARNLSRTRTGRGFFALRENEKAAATLGVGLTRYKLLSFTISGGIAALAGALYATDAGFAQSQQWPTTTSLVLVAMVMIGGLGSIVGSVFGAFIVIGLPEFFHAANQWVVSIGTGILLIIVIVRVRGGVAGLLMAVRDRLVLSLEELGQQEQDQPRQEQPTPATPTG